MTKDEGRTTNSGAHHSIKRGDWQAEKLETRFLPFGENGFLDYVAI
jgi:hypothetical protein